MQNFATLWTTTTTVNSENHDSTSVNNSTPSGAGGSGDGGGVHLDPLTTGHWPLHKLDMCKTNKLVKPVDSGRKNFENPPTNNEMMAEIQPQQPHSGYEYESTSVPLFDPVYPVFDFDLGKKAEYSTPISNPTSLESVHFSSMPTLASILSKTKSDDSVETKQIYNSPVYHNLDHKRSKDKSEAYPPEAGYSLEEYKPEETPKLDTFVNNHQPYYSTFPVEPRPSYSCTLEPGSSGQSATDHQAAILTEVGANQTNITVQLLDMHIWRLFSRVNNEMIVTKNGRRMFPVIRLKIAGLEPRGMYSIALEFDQIGAHRWKYVNGNWVAGGKPEPPPLHQHTIYIHSDSPNFGAHWMKGVVAFTKLKMTNKPTMKSGQPRIHVVPIDSQTEPSATKDQRSSLSDALCASKFSSKSKSYIADSNLIDNKIATFTFEETQFIAVTAYQNEDVTNLKIRYNPFAKAFQELPKPFHDYSTFQPRPASVNSEENPPPPPPATSGQTPPALPECSTVESGGTLEAEFKQVPYKKLRTWSIKESSACDYHSEPPVSYEAEVKKSCLEANQYSAYCSQSISPYSQRYWPLPESSCNDYSCTTVGEPNYEGYNYGFRPPPTVATSGHSPTLLSTYQHTLHPHYSNQSASLYELAGTPTTATTPVVTSGDSGATTFPYLATGLHALTSNYSKTDVATEYGQSVMTSGQAASQSTFQLWNSAYHPTPPPPPPQASGQYCFEQATTVASTSVASPFGEYLLENFYYSLHKPNNQVKLSKQDELNGLEERTAEMGTESSEETSNGLKTDEQSEVELNSIKKCPKKKRKKTKS